MPPLNLYLVVILCLIGANLKQCKGYYDRFIHWANTTQYRAEAVALVVISHVLVVYFFVVFLAY